MKIALIGYGKMGKEIEKVAVARGHEIVSIIDVDNQDDFNSEAFKSADVAIEFTNPMVAYDNYMKTFAAGVKLVSGSTGWMDKHGDEVKELCTKGGKTLFWSSNFSLGVAIFSAVNKYLAKIMNNFPAYEVSMTETHHIHKLDAPSGTAITLAEGILENMNRKSKWVKGTMVAPDGTVSGTSECAENEFPVIRSVKGRCLVFILSAMTLRRIASQLPMMPRIGRGLPWELFWRRNIHPGMKDY